MKYLFLIIRHIFPRHKWQTYQTTNMIENGQIIGWMFVQKDQFGNIKYKKIYASSFYD